MSRKATPAKEPVTALAVLNQSEIYDVEKANLIATQPEAVKALDSIFEIFKENEERDITANDFRRITTPKTAVWEIPDSNEPDGIRLEKTIEGVPIFWKMSRAYYPGKFGESPIPACYSVDAKTGIGNPGGECASCPLAKFGDNDETPECRLRTEVYLLTPGSILPTVLVFSPANNKAWSDFKREVFHTRYLPLHRAMVSFGLTPEKSSNKLEYMRITPRFLGAIPDDYSEQLLAFKRSLTAALLRENPANVLEEEAQDLASTIVDATTRWFVTVRGSVLDSDEARAEWLEQRTGMPSLANVVRNLTSSQYTELLREATQYIKQHDEKVVDMVPEFPDRTAEDWIG